MNFYVKVCSIILCISITSNFCILDPEKVLSKLTLPQKIAQLIIAVVISNEEKNEKFMQNWKNWTSCPIDHAYVQALIQEQNIGGVIFFGGNTSAQEQKNYTDYLQSISPLELLITLDSETSLAQRLHE